MINQSTKRGVQKFIYLERE